VEAADNLILVAGLLLLLSIFAGLASSRIGAPLLLVFLGLGMLAGEDGPGGIDFDDFRLTYFIGSIALAVILFDGGLRTRKDNFDLARWPALVLATVGVVVTAGVTGAAASLALDVGWLEGFLVGTIVASTDAAAVFFLLHLKGLRLRPRTNASLEVESGLNDPMAVFLTLLTIELLTHGGTALELRHATHFVVGIVGGAALGWAAGHALSWMINRLELAPGLYPILAMAGALFLFGFAQTIGSSGFMAVYLAGLVLGNQRHKAHQLIGRFHDGLAWLAQITMFLILGLLVTPSELVPIAGPAVAVALVLVLVARPLAVLICLAPFRFAWSERLFISWVGLRGAVPIFLGTIPVLAGVPGAHAYFGVAFVVVLVSLVVQGWTIGGAARVLGVELPPAPEPSARADIDLPVQDGSQLAVFTVADGSEAASRGLGRLVIPETARVLAMIHEGRPVTPEAVRGLAPGDAVLVLADAPALAVMDRMFGRRADGARGGDLLGDFQVQGDTPAQAVAALYGFAAPGEPALTIAGHLERRLGTHPVVGDRVREGEIELIVAATEGDRIALVGIDLTPDERAWALLRARLRRLLPRRRRRPAGKEDGAEVVAERPPEPAPGAAQP